MTEPAAATTAVTKTATTASSRNASEIQSLTQCSERLAKSVDRWNDGYVWLGAVALLVAFGVFFAQYLIIKRGRQLSGVQTSLLAAKDRQLKEDLKQKDADIALADTKASEANVLAANAESGNLKLKTELENAKTESRNAESHLEEEQQKTAIAQKEAADSQHRLNDFLLARAFPRHARAC